MRKLKENREASANDEIYVEVDNLGKADLVKHMNKGLGKQIDDDKFINVQVIVNSIACKNSM